MNASDNLSEGRVAYVLARVNSGLATEWSQIAAACQFPGANA